MMSEKILIVDDDSQILESYQRTLRFKYDFETAQGPEEGLRYLREQGPFAVVVADLKMPGMDGISFLDKTRELFPDTIRILLTGYRNSPSAMAAVNSGRIFKFLTKPCFAEEMKRSLNDALQEFRSTCS